MTRKSLSNAPVPMELGAGSLLVRVERALKIGVVGFFRQSSAKQARRNLGSQQVQEEQLRYVEPFGVKPEDVMVLLAYGESGRKGVVRKKFKELMALIRRGRVGLVLLARHDRLGRNETDGDEIIELMARYGVLLMVDGRIFDPASEEDKFILSMYARFAAYENATRTRWLMLAKYFLAREGKLRITLPAGFVWANPNDPAYREAMKAAGLESWLDVSAHLVSSVYNDVPHYVLPLPSHDVHTCMRLMTRWALELGSVRKVVKRIMAGAGDWPRKGQLPHQVRNPIWTPETEPVWGRANDGQVRRMLRSPALWGTYRYSAPALVPVSQRGIQEEEEDA